MFVVAVLHEYGASVACLQNPTSSKSIHFVELATSFFHPLRYEFWGRPAPPLLLLNQTNPYEALVYLGTWRSSGSFQCCQNVAIDQSFQIPNAPNLPATKPSEPSQPKNLALEPTNQPTRRCLIACCWGKKKPSKKLRSKKPSPKVAPIFWLV